MSTVVKALSLLDFFGAQTSEIGLAEMARLSGFDKATAHRLLVALASKGFLEQDPVTRRYRLGVALVRLARVREASLPILDVARKIVDALSQRTGETVHVSQLAGGVLSSVYVSESHHANRVSVSIGQNLPFNCTASGLAFLSAASESFCAEVLLRPLSRMTAKSTTSVTALKKRIGEARALGYAIGDQGYEDGVFSVAAPIVASDGVAIGAVSITSPAARIDAAAVRRHGREACAAARAISEALGHRPAAA